MNWCGEHMTGPLRVNSAIDGIIWPGIPAANGASLLAILFQLEQTQWCAPDELLQRQHRQLEALFNHARTHVPFYRERLGQVGTLRTDQTWPDVWRNIPPLTRAE